MSDPKTTRNKPVTKSLHAARSYAAKANAKTKTPKPKRSKLWLVQLIHRDGPMGSWLCVKDPSKKLAPFFKKFGQRLSGRDYVVEISEVSTVGDPSELVHELTKTCSVIAEESNWTEWRP